MRVDDLYYTNDQNQKLECSFFFPEKFDPSHKYETVPIGHGLGGSRFSPYILASVGPIIDSNRVAVSYNLRGASPTNPVTRDLTPENGKSDLAHVMEFIADKPFVDKDKIFPINASYSGNLIMQYAADPDSVQFAGIISHATAVRPMSKFERKLKSMAGMYRRLWSLRGHYPVKIDQHICELPYAIYKFFSKYDLVYDAAPKIDVPVILVHGTKDDLAPIEDVRDFAKALIVSPWVRLHEIENAPHNMVDSDKGNFLTQAIEFSRQAVELISSGDFKYAVDHTDYRCKEGGTPDQLKIA